MVVGFKGLNPIAKVRVPIAYTSYGCKPSSIERTEPRWSAPWHFDSWSLRTCQLLDCVGGRPPCCFGQAAAGQTAASQNADLHHLLRGRLGKSAGALSTSRPHSAHKLLHRLRK
eukprot:378320-Prymnesium_polylepis.1